MSAWRFIASCSPRSRSVSIIFCLKTSTAWAMSPISSLRSRAGISAVASPPASLPIAAVMPATGVAMPRPMTNASKTPSRRPNPATISCVNVVWAMLSLVTVLVAARSAASDSWATSCCSAILTLMEFIALS
jgi:hypothetical protein